MTQNEYLKSLNLSLRAEKALRQLYVSSDTDLASVKQSDLKKIPGVGRHTVSEIKIAQIKRSKESNRLTPKEALSQISAILELSGLPLASQVGILEIVKIRITAKVR